MYEYFSVENPPGAGWENALALKDSLPGLEPTPPFWTQPGSYAPNGLPADPQPALYPGAPIPPALELDAYPRNPAGA